VPEPLGEVVAPPVTDRPEHVVEPEAGPSLGSAPDPAPAPDPDHGGYDLGELLGTIGDHDAEYRFDPNVPRPRTLADAIDDCEEYDDMGPVCRVQAAAAVDSRGAFIVLTHTGEEAGPPVATLSRDDGSARRALFSFDAFGAPLPAIRRRLRRHGRLPALPNLVTARAYVSTGLGVYPALLALSGPLDGWVLRYDTTGLADRLDRLQLMRSDGSDLRTLATRPSRTGSCDPGGHWCEINNTDPHAECTDAMLEAEGRLCKEPTAVIYVAVAPNGRLLIIGYEITVEDHFDLTPATYWSVMLPDDLRP